MDIIKIKGNAINLNHVRYCEVDYTYETDSKTWFVYVSFDIGGCKILCQDEKDAHGILEFIVYASSK